MNESDRNEINQILRKYACQKEAQVIVDHTFSTGRINKRELKNDGYSDNRIRMVVDHLSILLKDFDPKENK
jgi:hypothetical protein